MLEAKAKDQGHKCKCIPKKKGLKNFFSVDLQKKTVYKNIFQPIYEILTIQKIVLSSSRGQGNFRGLEAFEAKDLKLCPRGRPRGLHLCTIVQEIILIVQCKITSNSMP